MFASFGMKVIGVDINQDVVDSINKGIAHISEPALEDIVSKTVSNGSLRATRFSEPADAFLIAVPTPFEDGEHVIKKPNLSYLCGDLLPKLSFVKNQENSIEIEIYALGESFFR